MTDNPGSGRGFLGALLGGDSLAAIDQKIEASKFFIDINNELGLDYQKVRGKLLQLSLTDYPAYSALREAVLEGITREQTKQAYITYWRILKEGVVKTAGGNVEQLEAKFGPFKPQLPDHVINAFSQRAAKTILQIAQECVDEIMPENFLSLSESKQKDLLVAQNMIKK
jgi:hypothetical protein